MLPSETTFVQNGIGQRMDMGTFQKGRRTKACLKSVFVSNEVQCMQSPKRLLVLKKSTS